jgi:ribose 5-phosphate isomerase A
MPRMADAQDAEKAAAARAAVARVRPGMKLALGTGSTAAHAVRGIANRFPEGATLQCVASSERTEALAKELGVAVRALRADDKFDMMLDGADEVDPNLALTKGGGGALFREKFLARRAREVVIMVDPSKLVERLASRAPIPVEVVPYARESIVSELPARGLVGKVRMAADGGTFRSDNGLEILDVRPRSPVSDPGRLDADLRSIPGVVETGIFVGLASTVIVGHSDGSVDVRGRGAPGRR